MAKLFPQAQEAQDGRDSDPSIRQRSDVKAQRRGDPLGQERGGARLLAITLFAPAALGLVMTVTLLPIVLGLPLLLLYGPPWWVSMRVARGRASFGRAAWTHTLLAVAVWTLGWLGGAAVGLDDLDTIADAAVWGLLVLPYTAVMVVGVLRVAASRPERRAKSLVE